jgi:hypothetical protein
MATNKLSLSAKFAIPCLTQLQEVFFVTFNTTDEKKAFKLAECIQGRRGKKSMVILTDDGDVYTL